MIVANKSLRDLFSKLKDDLSKKVDEKIYEQNAKSEKLESTISIYESTMDQLMVKCDDNKHYTSRSCLRINGVEVKGKKGR